MTTTLDTNVLEQLSHRVFSDFAAAMTLPLVRLGDRLGLYRSLCEVGPCSSTELAAHAGLPEPVVTVPVADVEGIGFDLEKRTVKVEKVNTADAQIQAWMDPGGVLNPGKGFPA